ncbi:MAG: hypothetical protein AAFX87_08260 [Bacteroidota bacterium]
MITITNLEYELEEGPDDIISRLGWATADEDLSWFDKLGHNPGVETNRDWVGKIDNKNLRFSLKQPKGLAKRRFDITVDGELIPQVNSTLINVSIGLNLRSFVLMVFIYLGAAWFIYDSVSEGGRELNPALVLLGILIPAIVTTIIAYRLKRAENKLDKLFR